MKKRIISLLLFVLMLISVFQPITASAYTAGYDGMGPVKISGGQRDFKWPVPGNYNIQSCFYDHREHYAIDISAAQGTSIVVSYPGTVVKAVDGGTTYYGDGFGNYVVIKHNYKTLSGQTITLYSRYSHMYSVSASEGQSVSAGTVIGKVGATGQVEGPHLDFQILYGGWSPYKTYSIDPYANDLLELPSSLVVYDSWDCGKSYYNLIKQKYSSPISVTVTFNANGGSCSTATKSVTKGGSISSLPTATRSNYTFDGWYTAASGGTKITTSTTFSSNTTVYAHWTINTANVKMYGADGSSWKTSAVNLGSNYTLPSDYPTKSGSYFCGWSYTKGASNYDVRPGDSISVSAAVSLYPVYVTHEKAISGEEVYIYNISDFTDDGYDIKATKHTTEKKIDTSYWTSWSAYSLNKVTASDTVQVRTTPMYRYYYFKCPYCGAHEPFTGTSDCGKTIPADGSAWNSTWSTIAYSKSNYKSFSYTTAKYYTTSLGDGQLWCFSAGNVNDTKIGTQDAAGSNSVIETGYSSRKYVSQYKTETTTVTGYTITPSGCKHEYTSEIVPATCTENEYTVYTCKLCGDSYKKYNTGDYSEWTITRPTGVDESKIETKTQYRYSDYQTKTSYNTSESGWTQQSSTWEQSGTGSVQYVKSWPSGFSTSNSLYSTYNKSPKSASETATAKTTINSDKITGYLYYHWCRGTYTDGPINRATSKTKSGEFTSFHAFYNTKAPSSLTASPDGDGSYTFSNGSCCKDSYWYYYTPVYTQSYTTYKKLFTYSRWTDWSAWSDTVYTANGTRKVETQTLYRYVNEKLGEHTWNEGVVTKAASCTEPGVKTYTCSVCNETKTEQLAALGHNYENGICTRCKAIDPDYQANPVMLTVGIANAVKGETVTIPVNISDNIGFAGFTLSIKYNTAALTLVDITKGDVLQTSDSGMLTKNVEGNTVNYTDTNNITSEGTLINLVFKVSENAVADSYAVSVELKDGKTTNFVNENSKAVSVSAQNGAVTVLREAINAIEQGKLVVSNERARAGEEVTVSVSLSDNPGIMVMALGIDYDRSKLQLIGHEDGVLTGWYVANNAVWIGDNDVTANGVILKLKFKVLDDVEEGDVQITLLYSDGDIANHDETIVRPTIENGKVTVIIGVPGDVTGDGKVNALDLLRMKKYLAGEDVTLEGSADVTGDGNVNALDLLRLKKYLAGENVTLC